MIILLGVTGSGKSLQSRLIADEYGYAWISSGSILRVLMTGEKRREMLAGKLVSDQEMIRIMGKIFELIDPKQQMVLDGFPRTMAQADWLNERAKAGDFEITVVFNFDVPPDVVHDRLISRGRFDDTEAAISQRFEEYKAVTLPIIEHLSSEGYQVIKIDATANPKAIHENIVKIVNEISSKN
jgi:adenylate kinase